MSAKKRDKFTETISIEINKTLPDDHSASAAAVAASIEATDTFIRKFHEEQAQNKRLVVNARALKPRSLWIPLDLTFFDPDFIPFAPAFFENLHNALRLFLELRIRLGSQEFSIEEGNVIVQAAVRQQVNAGTLLRLRPTSEESQAFQRAFRLLEKDDAVTSLEFHSRMAKTRIVRVDRTDFAKFVTPLAEEAIDLPKHRTTREVLSVRSVSFDRSLAWYFVWNGRNISAVVKHEEFLARVERGEVFRSGDQLIVDLERSQVYDPVVRTHIDKGFAVVTVHGHVQSPEQGSLFI